MKHQMIGKICKMAVTMSTSTLFVVIVCVEVLAGHIDAVNPNTQKDYDILPGMKMWDGKPVGFCSVR